MHLSTTLSCSSKRADPTRTRSDKNHCNRNYNDHHHHYYFVKARGRCDDNEDKREWQRMATETTEKFKRFDDDVNWPQ